jgi:hypothetical protein
VNYGLRSKFSMTDTEEKTEPRVSLCSRVTAVELLGDFRE